ncbi:MAG: hypothetical protein M9936_09365 [Caldilinea sp.]|nr:hypothetical protein [Caldilinea sp.]MCB9116740.1 hypothetical protein [Caldilineaceae bacterium]MCB9121098.1 hypothetical protein [Caldilineaceae bacterium]MCB9124723.1 hypothetical protein [Caldilineaceae bacterium]MCO5209889.1 hypothetical protein [Caldilinea sp.]
MSSNRDQIVDELKADFADGGHVLISDNFREPVSANAQAVAYVPDIIRWALEHKGVNITEGDISAGIRTVDCWHWEKFFGKKYKINEPNQWLAYAGWEP